MILSLPRPKVHEEAFRQQDFCIPNNGLLTVFSGDTIILMDISFDPAKRLEALRLRGLDFADAGLMFMGRTITVQDERFDYSEDRFISAGHLSGRCVVLVWTPRDGSRRIISMRYAHAREEAAWFS